MIQKTGHLIQCFESDNESYKELIDLYNAWYAEVCFLSSCSWTDTNENWKKMHEYCKEHPDILENFWLEIYQTFGEVGHFTFMLDLVFPGTVEVVGYCPLKDIEEIWAISFYALRDKKRGNENS